MGDYPSTLNLGALRRKMWEEEEGREVDFYFVWIAGNAANKDVTTHYLSNKKQMQVRVKNIQYSLKNKYSKRNMLEKIRNLFIIFIV